MDNATMLYRPGGMEMLHGFMVDWQIVDGHEVEQALADGWFLTPSDAGLSQERAALERIAAANAVPADDAPVTRAELEAKAKELGIKFDGRTTDKKLGDLINAKLRG